mmetsp:Transcript_10819/g.37907  ORF Transcript_10819/g.37907 Transcript_10819/m.37907 type:complete len:117 (+) Transcript_10819:260-610(+)
MACALAERFHSLAENHGVRTGTMSLHQADFLGHLSQSWTNAAGQHWWELADVAYACSPKFSKETMAGLDDLAALMRPGAYFVTVRHPLQNSAMDEVWRGEAIFSWGRDDLIVYRHK